MKKRTLCLILVAVMSLTTFTWVSAADAVARTVSIFKIEGKDVKMTKGTEKEFSAKAGMSLFGGYTVSTGANSYAYLKLDEDSLIKMDQKSKVKVNKQTSKKLSVSVLSGGLAVDAATQTDGKSMEIRAGNSALAIRGTYFVVEIMPTGTKFTMFEGSGVMSDGTEVPHGKMLIITEEEDGTQTQELVDIKVDETTSAFLLQNIVENKDALTESGVLTQEDIDKAQEIIKNAPAEPTMPEPTGTETGTNTNEQKYYTTEPPKSGGSGGSGITTYTITYNANGGANAPVAQNTTSGNAIAASQDSMTAPSGYNDIDFIGWNTVSDGSGKFYQSGASITVSGNMTLYAMWSGDGSANPILISSQSELSGISSGLAFNYILVSDISLSGSWSPIGNATNKFTGNFNGNNHIVSLNNVAFNDVRHAGLFGYIDTNGKVENLNVTGSITSTTNSGDPCLGGIAGQNDGTVEYCSSNVYITSFANNSSSFAYTGGIAGDSKGIISKCYSSGIIKADGGGWNHAGGIAGNIYADSYITSCYSIASVEASGDSNYAGGIVGQAYGSVDNCYATGNIKVSGTGNYYAGGCIGFANNNLAKIENCYATGKVEASGNGADKYSGGFVGHCDDPSGQIRNCVAFGNSVSGGSGQTGRILGGNNGTLTNNYAYSGMMVNGITVSDDTTNPLSHTDGKGVASTDYNTKNWWENPTDGPGWFFGGNANNPWVWGGNLPKLYWE